MTYRRYDSGSLMQMYKGGAGAGYTKGEQVETDEVYKLLTKGGTALGGGNSLVKLVKVPKKSTVLPEIDNKAYAKVVQILQGEIKRLAKLQNSTNIKDSRETSYLGEAYVTKKPPKDYFDTLSPQHAQFIIKSADKLYNVYDSLTDDDWNDIMEDVGIIKKKRGVNTYTYKQIKEEAAEIVAKYVKERSFDSKLALDDFAFKHFLNKELKERRNVLANSFGAINMTATVRESDVIKSSYLEVRNTDDLDEDALRENNLGLGTATGADKIYEMIQAIYTAVLKMVGEYAQRHPETDLDVYLDGNKKRRSTRAKKMRTSGVARKRKSGVARKKSGAGKKHTHKHRYPTRSRVKKH
jgi:hypothetical protein